MKLNKIYHEGFSIVSNDVNVLYLFSLSAMDMTHLCFFALSKHVLSLARKNICIWIAQRELSDSIALCGSE